ncbi:hypothetical protein J6590_040074, partial [Homalodisca vitripennis]
MWEIFVNHVRSCLNSEQSHNFATPSEQRQGVTLAHYVCCVRVSNTSAETSFRH